MIKSKNNPFIKHLILLRKNKKYRYEKKSLLIPGEKMVSELYKKGLIKTVITTEKKQFFDKKTVFVTYEIMKKITNLPSPENICAEVPMPKEKKLKNEKFLIMLDNIQDPGNVGTLIRTAHSFSFCGVIITKNTCDPYNEKALRAAKGSSFSIPIFFKEKKEIIKQKKFYLYLADIKGISIKKLSYKTPFILILSNESKGASFIKDAKKITIPINKNVNSLNVSAAGAILMYHMRKL